MSVHAWGSSAWRAAAEGSVHACCARLAPEYVDAPPAVDPSGGRMLFADGGPTLHETGRSSPDTVEAMIIDYARLQRATVGHHRAAAGALQDWDPADAGAELERQLSTLHELPRSDPRHITTAQRDQLLIKIDIFQDSGRALTQSPTVLPGAR